MTGFPTLPPGGSTVAPQPVADPPPGVPPGGPSFPTPPSQTDPNASGPSGFDQIGKAIGDPLSSIGNALAPLKSLADIAGFIGKAALWVADRHNWVRILEVVLGAAGVIVGIVMIDNDLKGTVQDVAPALAMAALA